MNYKETMEKLKQFIKDFSNDSFVEHDYIIFDNIKYTKVDFNKFITAINTSTKKRNKNSESSKRYIEKHRDYHNTLVRLQYYMNKENKSQHDYEKIEELEDKLDEIRGENLSVRDKR